jgi:hypothetical protein
VQHDGQIPVADEVRRSDYRARGFLEWATREFFAAEFSELDRASLVTDAEIREYLTKARVYAEEGNYDDGASQLEA